MLFSRPKNNETIMATGGPSDLNDSENKPSIQGTLTFKLFLAVFASWMGSVAIGAVIGYSSPSIPMMKIDAEPIRITDNQGDWFASVMNIGALFGGPIGGILIENLGRRSTLVYISAPFMLGHLLIAYAIHVSMLFIGRILTGLCTGVVSIAVPVYVAELSPPAIRGQLSTVIQLSITIGLVYSYSFGYFLYWTWLAIACTAFPFIMATMMIFMPETPLWLMKHDKRKQAITALLFVRGKDFDIRDEFKELENSIEKQDSVGSFKISMLRDPTIYKPFIISLFTMFFQQFCGINAVVFYTVSIFKNAGSSIDPKLSAIIVGTTQVLGTFGASFVMDKVGRRVLLLISGAGMCVSLGIFGVYYYLVKLKGPLFETEYGWLPLACLILYNLFFAVGFGPIPWVLLGELFPLRAKGFASGFSTGFNWLCSFIITKEFSDMLTIFKPSGTYFFYAAICLAGCIFVFVFLFETKGRSFEEIEQEFKPKGKNKNVDESRL